MRKKPLTASPLHGPCVCVITGVPAAGKTTVATALAKRLPNAVHLRGDFFRRSIVSGRVDMGPSPTPEALEQLELRYRLSALVADEYAAAGFTVILEDVVVGRVLDPYLDRIRTRPRFVVMLHPKPNIIAGREAMREKVGYANFDIDEFWALVDAETPRVGLWLDTSLVDVTRTVDELIKRIADAAID